LWDEFSLEETREEALQGNQAKGDEDEENVALHAKKGRGDGKKDMSKVKCFACHKTGHYASQCPNKKKGKKETQVAASTSTEIDDFAEKFEKEFSLVSCLSGSGSAEFGDIGAWVVDSGSSRHMTGMRLMFLSVSETNSDCHVGCGTSTMHAVKGVGCVRFQLESGGSLEVAEVLFVLEMKVSFLSVSTLEDEGYGVVFQHGHVLIYPEGATLDAATVLGVRQGRLYRLLGQPVCESKGILDS
jgi:hypothetical protein